MQKDLRFKIIKEGMKKGITVTCNKYNISRTIYYRWLKRYTSQGIDGLMDQEKNFVPTNKTASEIESSLLSLIKTYPTYGPRTLNYLLEELGYKISESAVYNILKRNHLSNKEDRIKFAKKNDQPTHSQLPSLENLKSGECWVFWITEYGYFANTRNIYAYTFYDLNSRIACTRLYNEITFAHFEDLLSAVALSVASGLNMKVSYLTFFNDTKSLKYANPITKSKVSKTLENHGYEVEIHYINDHPDIQQINALKTTYVEGCLSFLMPLINKKISFEDIKIHFQDYIRQYNITDKLDYMTLRCTPVEYHNTVTNTKLILPIWAYMDRIY